jgi:hypothetical protein
MPDSSERQLPGSVGLSQAATAGAPRPQSVKPKRMTKTLLLVLALLLTVSSARAQQTQSGQPPAAPTQQPAGDPPQPAAGEEKEDIFTGYRKVAETKQDDFTKLAKEILPAVEKLSEQNPCSYRTAIATRIGVLRKSMNDWIAAYQKYIDKWNEANEKEIDEHTKLGADQSARQEDVPALLKSAQEELKEYVRSRDSLPADDEAARKKWNEAIELATTKIEELGKAALLTDSILVKSKLSQGYWEAKRQTIKQNREIVKAIALGYEQAYDSIIETNTAACAARTAPNPLKDMRMEKKK